MELKSKIEKRVEKYIRHMDIAEDISNVDAQKDIQEFLKNIHRSIAETWSSETDISYEKAYRSFAALVENYKDPVGDRWSWHLSDEGKLENWKELEQGDKLTKKYGTPSQVFSDERKQELKDKYGDRIVFGGTAHLEIVYLKHKVDPNK